jgi:GDPmannose 4,6-dehydratase
MKKNVKIYIAGYREMVGSAVWRALEKKGYEVHGMKRRLSLFNTDRIDHLYQDSHVDNRKFLFTVWGYD